MLFDLGFGMGGDVMSIAHCGGGGGGGGVCFFDMLTEDGKCRYWMICWWLQYTVNSVTAIQLPEIQCLRKPRIPDRDLESASQLMKARQSR